MASCAPTWKVTFIALVPTSDKNVFSFRSAAVSARISAGIGDRLADLLQPVAGFSRQNQELGQIEKPPCCLVTFIDGDNPVITERTDWLHWETKIIHRAALSQRNVCRKRGGSSRKMLTGIRGVVNILRYR